MSTPTERPPEPTPAAIARAIVTLSTAPTERFGAFFNTEERYSQYEQLVDCLTAERLSDAVPILWSQTKRDNVDERLSASLPTDEDRGLFGQLGDHYSNAAGIREDAAYLVGVEVGRRAQGQPPDDGLTSEQRAELSRLSPALRATVARGDCLARFHNVERSSRSCVASG